MSATIDPGLFDLIDQLAALDPKTQRKYLDSLTAPERRALDAALGQRWRRDPSTFAAHLDHRFKRWRYVSYLAEKYRQAVEGESIRQLWMVPFRYGKTELASVYGPAWALDRYPHLNIILSSYGHDLALKNSARVRDVLDQHDLNTKPRHGSRGKERWETEHGGQVMAAGVGGALTGFGGDLALVDDAHRNWQDAASQLKRDTVWDWFRSVLYTRLQTDTSAVIVLGTRWHEDDLAGRILASEDAHLWDVVRLTAIAEDPDLGRHPWERQPDPLGRQPGEVLEPERFSAETVEQQKRMLGSYLFGAMMQARPAAAEGEIIKRSWWKWYVARPAQADDWLMAWDASFKDTQDGSYCVGALWARVGANYYLCDLVRDRMDYPTFRAAVASFAARWPQCRKILVEDKANGPAVIADLRGRVAGLIARNPQGSKESRVHAISGTIEAGNVWLPDPSVNDIDPDVDRSFVHAYVEELSAFPTGSANDDQVDVTTMALLEWSNTSIDREPVTVTRVINDPWR